MPKDLLRIVAITSILVALLLLTILVTGRKSATPLENGLLQFVTFTVGIGFSYWLGRSSVHEAGREIVESTARSAVRRLLSLGATIAASLSTVEDARARSELAVSTHGDGATMSAVRIEERLNSIRMRLEDQQRSVYDAIDDWRQHAEEVVTEQIRLAEQRLPLEASQSDSESDTGQP